MQAYRLVSHPLKATGCQGKMCPTNWQLVAGCCLLSPGEMGHKANINHCFNNRQRTDFFSILSRVESLSCLWWSNMQILCPQILSVCRGQWREELHLMKRRRTGRWGRKNSAAWWRWRDNYMAVAKGQLTSCARHTALSNLGWQFKKNEVDSS